MDEAGSKRVLIIEDNDVLGDVINKKLLSEGYTTLLVRDGQEGLDQTQQFAPDLILLDILLPSLNGYEILEALNQQYGPNMFPPVIIISNSGQPVEISKILALGAKDYIVKVDFTPEDVLRKVEAQLELSSGGGDDNMFRQQDFKILVVEDDGFLRDLISRKLTHEQFNLLIAADGEEGLDLARSEKPSIILLDLILPGMNGFEVLEQIRAGEETKNIPVIILSNLGQENDIEKAKRIGADEFLIKSNFNIDEVITKMKEIIAKRKAAAAEGEEMPDESAGAAPTA